MVSRLAPFQHAFVQRLSELDIAYHGSPIVEGPGKRYFDDSMRGGKGISSRFLVVIGDDTESSTRRAAKQLCESFSDIVELRSSRHPGMMLVRPDGYIAYATHSRGGVRAVASLRSVLERQTAQSHLQYAVGIERLLVPVDLVPRLQIPHLTRWVGGRR
jgi:hypothetical protein